MSGIQTNQYKFDLCFTQSRKRICSGQFLPITTLRGTIKLLLFMPVSRVVPIGSLSYQVDFNNLYGCSI